MHFCITAQYTPSALNAIMENPTTNRQEVIKKLLEGAGGKLISMKHRRRWPWRVGDLRCT